MFTEHSIHHEPTTSKCSQSIAEPLGPRLLMSDWSFSHSAHCPDNCCCPDVPPPSFCRHPRQYADLLEGLATKQRALEAYAGGGRAAELGRVKQRLEDLGTRLAATQQVGQGARWQGTACVACGLCTW